MATTTAIKGTTVIITAIIGPTINIIAGIVTVKVVTIIKNTLVTIKKDVNITTTSKRR